MYNFWFLKMCNLLNCIYVNILPIVTLYNIPDCYNK